MSWVKEALSQIIRNGVAKVRPVRDLMSGGHSFPLRTSKSKKHQENINFPDANFILNLKKKIHCIFNS